MKEMDGNHLNIQKDTYCILELQLLQAHKFLFRANQEMKAIL